MSAYPASLQVLMHHIQVLRQVQVVIAAMHQACSMQHNIGRPLGSHNRGGLVFARWQLIRVRTAPCTRPAACRAARPRAACAATRTRASQDMRSGWCVPCGARLCSASSRLPPYMKAHTVFCAARMWMKTISVFHSREAIQDSWFILPQENKQQQVDKKTQLRRHPAMAPGTADAAAWCGARSAPAAAR